VLNFFIIPKVLANLTKKIGNQIMSEILVGLPKKQKVRAYALFGTKEFKYETQYFQTLLILMLFGLITFNCILAVSGKKQFFFFLQSK